MLILAFESSAKAASAALVKDGKLISQYSQCSGLTHSRTLLPMAEDMLKNAEMKLSDVDLIAVAHGPGSFTGIRIGVAAVKGFALSGNKPAAGISTLEATAALVPQEGLICSIIRARENEYFYGFFRKVRGELYRICDDECMYGHELKSILYGADWLLCGDGAEDFLKNNPCDGWKWKIELTGIGQHASGGAKCAWELAQCDSLSDGNDIMPVYLKKTQAERMREEKTK